MVVKLRLKRFGRLNHPTYRLCATDSRNPRDGRIIESLGYYLPLHKREGEQFSLNGDRVKYWLSVGAQASDTARMLIHRAGIALPVKKKHKRAKTKAKAKAFAPPRKRHSNKKPKPPKAAATEGATPTEGTEKKSEG